jgi:hypothetical protein
MTAYLTVVFLVVSLCAPVVSDTTNWSGEFQDGTFGGSLFVCLSEVAESDTTVSTVAQGVFSKFGYMRGPVEGDVWMGEFFMAGIEARHGTFNLTLGGGGGSYSGVFSEAVGYSYGMSGDKVSTGGYVPADTDCFKSDPALLTQEAINTTSPFSYTSNAIATNIARYLYERTMLVE